MRLQFRRGSGLTSVRIDRRGQEFRVSAADRTFVVSIAGAAGPRLDLIVDGRPVRAVVVADGERRYVKIGGADPVTLERVTARGPGVGTAAPGEEGQTAPMEGQVTSVPAREGQEVRPGTLLVVLEAMKMEMRLVAPFAGRVKRVHCAAGDVVERGRLLVELERSA